MAIVRLAGALAHAWMLLGTDTARPGQIAALVSGSGTFSAVDISERLDGADVPVRSVAPPATTDPDGQVCTRRGVPARPAEASRQAESPSTLP